MKNTILKALLILLSAAAAFIVKADTNSTAYYGIDYFDYLVVTNKNYNEFSDFTNKVLLLSVCSDVTLSPTYSGKIFVGTNVFQVKHSMVSGADHITIEELK